MRPLVSVSALVLCALALPSSGQRAGTPNTGIDRPAPPAAFSHAEQQAAIDAARAEQPDPARLERLQLTNLGALARIDFTGHVLTDLGADAVSRVLYAPSEADDVAWRGMLATMLGGATVDYFDTRVATPDVALLSTYDAVFTWVNYVYADNVLFGDNLAAYSDLGGDVVLGVFCTYTSGNYLSGAIMTPGYCPVVSPLGTNHFSTSSYAGDGVSCIYNGVASLDGYYRDVLAPQGAGIADGTFLDGEICHAYRPVPAPGMGEIVYSNGAGTYPLYGGGDWYVAVANAMSCMPGAPQLHVLYAPTDPDDPTYRAQMATAGGGAVVDYFDARAAVPTLAQLQAYDVVYTWANYVYFDNVAMGDVLADYVDQGGSVVLGAFCTYTSGNFLSGRIMTPAYSPVVSPTGSNHFLTANYVGDGTTCIYNGVTTALDCYYRDYLAVQGGGLADGHYADGEICHAFQTVPPVPGAGTVAYSNGAGGASLGGAGEWYQAIVNAGMCIAYGAQVPRNSAIAPQNANAWLVDVAGPPSVKRGAWKPRFDGRPSPTGPWTPAIGAGSMFYIGLFTGPATVPVSLGGSDPWVLGSLLPPNPVGTVGPFAAAASVQTLTIPIPPVPALIGDGVTTQVLVFDLTKPVPFRLTDALDLIVGT